MQTLKLEPLSKTIKQIELDAICLYFLEGNVVHAVIKNKAILTLEEVLRFTSILDDELKDRKVCFLIEAEEFSVVDTEAKEYLASEAGHRHTLAQAFYVRNYAQKMMVQVYITFNKPSFPIKVYTNKEKALNWLKTVNPFEINKKKRRFRLFA